MTRQLLAFSRKQVVRPEVLNLNRVIEGIDKMLRRILREDIELHLELSKDLGSVEADPGQIDQVILNLAANARDAMPRGGRFTLKTSNAELDPGYFQERGLAAAPGSYVVLSVSDTGVGMDKDTLSRIYEPFFTTKEREKGTGMGLATVYGIVKQAGGHVFAYSEPGLGATFRVYLPRVYKERQEPAMTRKPEPKGSETILVVEDDEAVRRLAVRSLERFGYAVLDAPNGEAAVETLAGYEGEIHLVLTDVVMPRMGGRELAEKAKEIRPGLKVVFMSGYIDDTVFRQGIIEKGANFIEKPFSPTDLANKIREVLDGEEV
jgi:CheY-like chemotaxis protein